MKSTVKEDITIGKALTVHRLGLGTNRIRQNDESRHALEKAVALGINFIDTAAAYTNGASEETIGEVLSTDPNVIIATKGGLIAPDFHIDGSPQSLSKAIAVSLKRLKRQSIDLYFLHRVDPNVPLKESMLFLKQMQKEGKIKHIGLSQVSIEQIEEARNYVPIAAVENEYNLSERSYDDVVTYTEKEKIVFVPFFPIHFRSTDFPVLVQMQRKYQATATQLALAWLLQRSPNILPIPGSLSITHLEENVAASSLILSDEDFKKL